MFRAAVEEAKKQEEHGSLRELRRQSWELQLTKAARVFWEDCFTERAPEISRQTLKSLAKADQLTCIKIIREQDWNHVSPGQSKKLP